MTQVAERRGHLAEEICGHAAIGLLADLAGDGD